MLRLDPSPVQRAALFDTMRAFNAAATDLAAWACEHGTSSKWAIQSGCYRDIRERHGLSAQMTVRAIKVAADAQKRMPKGKAAQFKPRSAVVYDSRIMSFKGAENISLWTVAGRQLIPMRLGDYQRARMDRQRGEADLLLRDGVFYLAVCLDAPEPDPADAVGTLGIDLGIVNLATDSDGATHSGETVEHCRARYAKRRATLQAVGTRSARRRLMKTRRREARFRRQENHVISKTIVRKAQDTKRRIAVEELTGIRARTTVRRSQRDRHQGWAFAQLRAFITYKAALAGVPLVVVDPRNTSRECAECGHTDKANRRSQAEFECRSCGHAAPADVNAARNIASRGEVMRPMVPGGLAVAA
jgi:IS605 OrfB family transposase